MHSFIKKFLPNQGYQRGATAVEFVIVIMVFVMIIFGIIEFGLYMYNQHVITNAGREGARAGIAYKSGLEGTDIRNIVESYCEKHVITFGDGTPDISLLGEVCAEEYHPGKPLTVMVNYKYEFLLLPLEIPIKSTTTMKCE